MKRVKGKDGEGMIKGWLIDRGLKQEGGWGGEWRWMHKD